MGGKATPSSHTGSERGREGVGGGPSPLPPTFPCSFSPPHAGTQLLGGGDSQPGVCELRWERCDLLLVTHL